jgi:hypothetical protein
MGGDFGLHINGLKEWFMENEIMLVRFRGECHSHKNNMSYVLILENIDQKWGKCLHNPKTAVLRRSRNKEN